MAKINFNTPLLDLKGNQIAVVISHDQDAPRVLGTLAVVCVEALLSPLQDEKPTGEMKMRRYELAKRIHPGGEVSLPAEDIAMLKTLVGRAWPALIQGAAWELLDPPA